MVSFTVKPIKQHVVQSLGCHTSKSSVGTVELSAFKSLHKLGTAVAIVASSMLANNFSSYQKFSSY